MAGFDFTFRCKGGSVLLGRALLRRAQRLATNFDLKFRYRATPSGWYVTVNGPLPCMQALIHPMVVQFLPFADGFQKPKSRSQRRRVIEQLVNEYCGGLLNIQKMIEDISHKVGGTPKSYFFNEGSATHLSAQLREFERLLILFHNGLVSASEFAEGAHTITESVLKACLPPNERRSSFADLLNRVAQITGLVPDHKQALLRLKDRRKMAKHRGQRVRYADMAADLDTIVAALHFLFRHLRLQSG